MMNVYDPNALFHFLQGNYDDLFRRCRNYSEVSEYAHLAATGKRRSWWVVTRPLTNRLGVVLWSNFMRSGSKFRTSIPLTHAKRPRRVDAIDTIVDPRRLIVVPAPRKKRERPLRLLRPHRGTQVRRAA